MQRHARRKISRRTSRKPRKVRLAIECSFKERKYLKIFAAHEDKTLNEFVMDCVRLKMHRCLHSHEPNEETAAALRSAEKGEGLISFESIEDFYKSLKD